MKINKKYILFIAIILIAVLFDQITKICFDGKIIPVLKGIVSIDGNAHNTGAAFSMFSNSTLFLTIFSVIMLIVFTLAYVFFKINNTLYFISVSMICGGALGNIIDRVMFGYVRDFVKVEFFDFAIFNIADSFICIGVILLIFYILFIEGKENKS